MGSQYDRDTASGISNIADLELSLDALDDTVKVDDAAFTPGTSKVLGIGCMADDTSPDSVNEGDIGIPRMSLDRKQYAIAHNETNSIYAEGTALVPKFVKDSIAASATDDAIIAAVASKKLRVLSFIINPAGTATAITFNSKPGGAGSAISAVFTVAANTPFSSGYNPLGWFETVAGEGLSGTTGTGSTVGVQITYVEV